MREHKCGFLHNNRPAVLLMHPCITIGCQLISPLSKYLKALVLTKKVSTLFERTRSLVTFLKNAQNSLSQPDTSSPGTISSRGYLSKLDVSEGPCTFGVIGGSRVRLSKPSQSKPWNQRCFLMSATPSFWYPILSTGFSLQNRFIRVTAVRLTFLGTVIWSKPLRMML